MNGCIYRTKDGECDLYSEGGKYKVWCTLRECPSRTPSYADRIRAMTDEELAEFLAEYRCTHKAPHCMEANCAQCWLEWLRQEAEEGAGTT